MFPKIIKLKFVNSTTELPIKGLLSYFVLPTMRYSFLLPLSNENGNVMVDKEWIEKEIKLQCDAQFLDYASTLKQIGAVAEINVPIAKNWDSLATMLRLTQHINKLTNAEIRNYCNNNNHLFAPSKTTVDIHFDDILDIIIFIGNRAQGT